MKTIHKLQILAGILFFALLVMSFSVAEIATALNQESALTAKQILLLIVHGIWITIWCLCILFTFRLTLKKTPALAGEQ